MAQSICNVKEVYKVPASIFVPKPKVDANVIQLTPKPLFSTPKDMPGKTMCARVRLIQLNFRIGTYTALENLLRYYFTKRRKTMGNLTKRLGKEVPQVNPLIEEIETIIDFQARPEDITNEQFLSLAKLLYKHQIIKLPLI